MLISKFILIKKMYLVFFGEIYSSFYSMCILSSFMKKNRINIYVSWCKALCCAKVVERYLKRLAAVIIVKFGSTV